MLEILQFIFSSFWVWIGTVILIAAPLAALRSGEIIAIRWGKR